MGSPPRSPGRNLYRFTADGLRFATFCIKLQDRLLQPLFAADQTPAPSPLRNTLHTIDIHIADTKSTVVACYQEKA